jgi:hypothetical protein
MPPFQPLLELKTMTQKDLDKLLFLMDKLGIHDADKNKLAVLVPDDSQDGVTPESPNRIDVFSGEYWIQVFESEFHLYFFETIGGNREIPPDVIDHLLSHSYNFDECLRKLFEHVFAGRISQAFDDWCLRHNEEDTPF